MQRLIQDLLRRALADELLFGRLVSGGGVTLDIDGEGKVLLEFDEPKPSTSDKKRDGNKQSKNSSELVHE